MLIHSGMLVLGVDLGIKANFFALALGMSGLDLGFALRKLKMQGMESAKKMHHFCRVWKMQGIMCIIVWVGKCKEWKMLEI